MEILLLIALAFISFITGGYIGFQEGTRTACDTIREAIDKVKN